MDTTHLNIRPKIKMDKEGIISVAIMTQSETESSSKSTMNNPSVSLAEISDSIPSLTKPAIIRANAATADINSPAHNNQFTQSSSLSENQKRSAREESLRQGWKPESILWPNHVPLLTPKERLECCVGIVDQNKERFQKFLGKTNFDEFRSKLQTMADKPSFNDAALQKIGELENQFCSIFRDQGWVYASAPDTPKHQDVRHKKLVRSIDETLRKGLIRPATASVLLELTDKARQQQPDLRASNLQQIEYYLERQMPIRPSDPEKYPLHNIAQASKIDDLLHKTIVAKYSEEHHILFDNESDDILSETTGQTLDQGEAARIRKELETLSRQFINQFDDRGYTALHYAASNGMDEVVAELCERGAIIEPSRNERSETPVELAKKQNHEGIVQFLEGHVTA